ncbi:MAG: Gfo/Idh/MocA family oxidoreductase [Bryobacteraceae bacterium]|nr:Gfo/Idh/MocA family oxidoreductase [Bryobacteraceae bacterium]
MTRREILLALGAAPLARLAAASERINVGFIGVGNQGMSRVRGFLKHPDVNPVAVCDLDTRYIARAMAYIGEQRNVAPVTFSDYRKLLAMKDLDAVCIATPDHWHALPAIEAFRAGKDVFVEKPLSYSIGEGRAMANAVRKYNRVSQMGNHIHNDLPNYRRVVELVKSGVIGKVERVQVWRNGESKGIGAPANSAPPKELDYEFWLGPAPRRAYNENRSHFKFRYFWDYSGGMFIDFFCHITDVVYWALDLTAPRFVAATGHRDLTDDNAETPNRMEVQYEYPGGLSMVWSMGLQGPPGLEDWAIGAAFQGTEGTLVTDYGRHKLFRKGKEVAEIPAPKMNIPDSPGHIREFLNSMKSRERCTCDVEYGHKLTKAGHLGNIAYRTGHRIEFDDKTERIVNDKAADRMTGRKYRKPWKLS